MNRLELTNAEIHEKAHAVLQKYHPDLASVGVRLTVLFSRKVSKSGEYLDGKDSLRCNRKPAAATIKLATEHEKALGSGDAIIVLDHYVYSRVLKDERRRDSLFSHELHHLCTRAAKGGGYLRHPDGRPRLGTVPHDLEVGLFIKPIRQFGIFATDFLTADAMVWHIKCALHEHESRENEEQEGGEK